MNVKDPVCNMTINSDLTEHNSKFGGNNYYFCSESCKKLFNENPKKYIKKSVFTKFLQWLSKENEKEFGNKRLSCH